MEENPDVEFWVASFDISHFLSVVTGKVSLALNVEPEVGEVEVGCVLSLLNGGGPTYRALAVFNTGYVGEASGFVFIFDIVLI